jgi:predicted enzyme related to lactoylglutathione lyase
MSTGFHSVMIWTDDLGRLLPFYRDVLGLEAEMESDVFAVVAGGKLGIGRHSEVSGRSKEPQRIMVDLVVDDCRAEHRRLAERGVQFVREPSEDQGLMIATLLDPDGNMVQLFQEMGRP